MSAIPKEVQPGSKFLLAELAAWLSLLIAILMIAAVGAQLFLQPFEGEDLLAVEELWFSGLTISFIFGVISLFGFRHHRRKLTLWVALAGVLIGGGLAAAEVAFFIYLLMGFGHQ